MNSEHHFKQSNAIYTVSEKKQESPADARVTRDSAVVPRWPSAAILDIIEPKIAPFDPLTPKTLAVTRHGMDRMHR